MIDEIDPQAGPDARVPNNIEAEATVLGAMMQNPAVIDVVADILTADDFYEPLHGRIFSAIVGQYAQGKTPTPVTLRPFFEDDTSLKELGGPVYLARLTALESSFFGIVSPRENSEQIKELARRRTIQAALGTAASACSDMNVPIEEIVSHADTALDFSDKNGIVEISGGEAVAGLIKSFSEPNHGVECGQIPELDRVLGPIRPKNLVILAARPAMGKTAVSISYALGAAKRGHGVLFVSLEMSSQELAGRMVSDLCFTHGENSVPYAAISEGRLNDWQMRRVCEAESRMHNMPFRMIDTGSLTLGRLNMLVKRYVRRFAANGHKLELIVVDYLQLMRSGIKGAKKYEDVSEVSNGLKQIAKEHGVGILALCQLSREVEKRPDKRPILADLRDSGSIEQDADAVLFLLRDEYYLGQSRPSEASPKFPAWETSMEEVKGRIEFIVAKRRNGSAGTSVGEFHGAYQAVR